MSEMVAGLALNLRVAREVMGWPQWDPDKGDAPAEWDALTFFADWGGDLGIAIYRPGNDGDISGYFAPSESIADAWTVVEKLEADGWLLQLTRIEWVDTGETCRCWEAQFYSTDAPYLEHDGSGTTPGEAICFAALEVSGGSREGASR